MTKSILLLLCFLSFYVSSYSQKDLPFKAERLITDFRGTASNGELTLCYGDYGIITFTQNSGKNWEQINLGDKYNIKKIINVGKDFYGVTEYSLIKFNAEKRKWTNKYMYGTPDIISMALLDSTMYILTSSGVVKSGLNLIPDYTNTIALGKDLRYSEIQVDANNIYIMANDSIVLRYKISSKMLDTINLVGMNLRSDCNKISNMKLLDGALYTLLENRTGKHTFKTLVKSADGGGNWKKVTDSLYGYAYSLIGKDICEAYTSPSIESKTIIPYYYKINNDGSKSRVNSNDSGDRFFYYYSFSSSIADFINNLICDTLALTEVTRINNETLIGVGKHKQIVMSFDGGKSWQFKSLYFCFQSLSFATTNPYFVNDSVIVMQLYKSTDAGATWLPPVKNIKFNGKVDFKKLFKSDGRGVLFNTFSAEKRILYYLLTKDFGETYEYVDKPSIEFLDEGLNIYSLDGRDFCSARGTEGNTAYTMYYNFDSNMMIKDSVKLDSISMGRIIPMEDGTLYCFGEQLYKKNPNNMFFDSSANVCLYKSIDKGNSWNKVPVVVPFSSFPPNVDGGGTLSIFSFKGYIVIPYYDWKRVNGKYQLTYHIYRYDIQNNSFDTLKDIYPHPWSFLSDQLSSFSNYFSLNNILCTNMGKTIYYNQDFVSSPNNWDSIKLDEIFYNWKPVDGYYTDFSDKYNLNVWSNNKSAYLVYGSLCNYQLSSVGLEYQSLDLNLARLRPNEDELAVEDEAITENSSVYLYSYPPYPIPAKNLVSSHIYWDPNYDINLAEINAYDIYGMKVNTEKIDVEKTESYSGIMKWNCTNIPNGVYLIRISLAGSNINVPVVIAK